MRVHGVVSAREVREVNTQGVAYFSTKYWTEHTKVRRMIIFQFRARGVRTFAIQRLVVLPSNRLAGVVFGEDSRGPRWSEEKSTSIAVYSRGFSAYEVSEKHLKVAGNSLNAFSLHRKVSNQSILMHELYIGPQRILMHELFVLS